MKKKLIMTLAILACATLIVVGSVAGTLAYLRSSAGVVNTFTYGQVGITMDESQIGTDGLKPINCDADGQPTATTPRVVGNSYLLKPNTTYVKDPVIHIKAESQAMYLFVKIDNGIAGLAVEDSNEQHLTIHNQMLANGWKVYKDASDVEYSVATNKQSDSGVVIKSTSTVYYLSVGADAASTDAKVVSPATQTAGYPNGDIPTFTNFTTGTTPVTEASMTAYVNNNAQIAVTAYAVQAEADDFDNIHDAAKIFRNEWSSAVPAASNP